MWPRTVETIFGFWLLMSPFIFGHEARSLWANDLVSGCLLLVFSLASRSRRFQWVRLLTAGTGAWLALWGRFSGGTPLPPALQNDMMIGLLALMFAVIPNEASRPPAPWREDQRGG